MIKLNARKKPTIFLFNSFLSVLLQRPLAFFFSPQFLLLIVIFNYQCKSLAKHWNKHMATTLCSDLISAYADRCVQPFIKEAGKTEKNETFE